MRLVGGVLLASVLLALAPHNATSRKGKRASAGSGPSGWRAPSSDTAKVLLQQAACDDAIDVVHASELTAEEFHNNYLGKSKPLLIREATRAWRAHRHWRRKSFVESFGHLRAQTGNATDLVLFNGGWHVHARPRDSLAAFIQSFGEDTGAMIAKNYLDKPFVFEANELLGGSPELRSQFSTPNALRPAFSTVDEGRDAKNGAAPMWNVFSLGDDAAGLPFHSHGAAWLAVVHGAKHWLLYPPGGFDTRDRAATTPLSGVADWFHHTRPNLVKQPIECTQRPGEVLFVPTGWLQ